MPQSDPFALARFVSAQEGTYAQALDELRAGEKRSHWMWFIFPQLAGLGHSAMAQRYAISGLAEARAYLAHPLLGPRLLECCAALGPWIGRRSAVQIMGGIDALKLLSCLTLFERASGDAHFSALIAGFHDGARDQRTIALLAAH